ncbi:hypothetical protein C4561_00620 [candidate division WWE3 bacterium]|jgi:hypothetical protein|uniref:Laminin G domain-containing protein n=1 Tax=candidate division WWE3 bacterium TaxID=2053526 RepID=A0A3A4ZFR3_UNCKA|nr:MAG: hypothetical protein C4561_00620 [candidate division WWE3 bacterium]
MAKSKEKIRKILKRTSSKFLFFLRPVTKYVTKLGYFLLGVFDRTFKFIKKWKRPLVPFAIGTMVILIPLFFILLKNSKDVEALWSPGHIKWEKRQRITLTNQSSENLAASTTVAISVNTKELYDSGKAQVDCDDIRVLYQPNDSTNTEMSVHLEYPNNSACSTSESTMIYFPLQAGLNSGSTTTDYYLYFSNKEAGARTTTAVDAFDFSGTTATFVCPFRGTADCINGSGSVSANTESGSLRYTGLKSGVMFDGFNDYASAADSSSLSVTGDLTVETWVKIRALDAEQTIIGKWDETTANDDRSYRLYVTSGNKFAFSVSSAGTSASVVTITGSNTTITKSAWYHVAGVYDASAQTIDLYVNGTKDAVQIGSAGSSIDDNASLLYLGAKENTSGTLDTYLSGLVDETRISNTVRYTSDFVEPGFPHSNDFFTDVLYHYDEDADDSRQTGKVIDETANDNHATLSGGVYVIGFVGHDGPSEFGSHTGTSNSSVLEDSDASWVTNEWVGYILSNSTDASHGVITSNTANTLAATLAGGTDNDWDSGDLYTLSPDLGRVHSHSFASHNGIFTEEATTNKIENPSFENTTYDTGWVEGTGSGAVIAVTRTTANTGGGTQDITNSNLGGNTPKAVMIIATATTVDDTATDGVSMSYGTATGATNEWYTAFKTQNGLTSDNTDARGGTDATVYIIDPTASTTTSLGTAEFTQFLTNGVRINWTTTPTSAWHLTVVLFAGSGLQAYAGTQGLGTTQDSAFDITAPGFQPDIIFGTNGTVGSTQFYLSSFGVATYNGSTITQHALANRFTYISSQGAPATRYIDTGIVGGAQVNGNLVWYGELSAFDSSGFTITTRSGGASNATFFYLALDVSSSSSWVGTHTTPTSTGNYAETAPGFTPQFVFQVENMTEAVNTPYADGNAGAFGFSVFDPNESYSNNWAYEDGVSPVNAQTLSDDQAVNLPNDDGTTGITGTFVSMDTASGWTTNYTNVAASGKKFLAAAIESPEYLTKTIETSAPYVKFGSRSTKIVAAGSATSLVHSTNAGNTNTHTFSFYVYRGTAGNVGGTIDNTVAQAVWQGTAQSSTTYENVGGGWWRLSYTGTGTASAADYGVWLPDGETLYVDGFVLEEKSAPTTYADGSLGTGYTWSGTINESSSSRAAADLDYTTSTNIDDAAGSISVWINPEWDGDDGVEHTILDADTSAGTLKLYKTTGNNIAITDGTNSATSSTASWTKHGWHHIVATWSAGTGLDIYVDSAAGTGGSFSAPTLSAGNFYLGQDKTNAAHSNTHISDLRIYDDALSQAEVTDTYHAGLVSFEVQYEVDYFPAGKGQKPVATWHFDEGYGSIAHDSTTYENDLTISGATWQRTNISQTGITALSLLFDGTDDYLYRDADSDFNFGTTSFTISGWFRHPSTVSGTDTILARYGTSGYKIYMNSSGYVCFAVDDDSTWSPDDEVCTTSTYGSYADSTWHHFSAVKSGTSTIYIYMDGVLINSKTSIVSTGTMDSNSNLYVGIDSDATSNPWAGTLDELVFYPYERTADQIATDLLGTQAGVNFGNINNDVATDGLVGYWKMNESAADSCTGGVNDSCDSSGNNHDGAWAGNVGATSGKHGRGTSNDGTGDYISVTQTSALNFGDDFTVSLWMNTTTNNTNIVNDSFISKDLGGCGSGVSDWFANVRSGNVYFWTSGSACTTAISATDVNDGVWHHVVLTREKSTGSHRIYIDGLLDNEAFGNTGSVANTTDLIIGSLSASTSDTFLGNLDEVRVYNRLLSQREVNQLYLWAPGPVGHWKMDEGTGATAYDSSGNSNTGTLNGTPSWINGKFGNALDLNGSTDYINVGSGSTIDSVYYTNGTVSAWVKLDDFGDTNSRAILGAGAGTWYTDQSGDNMRIDFTYDRATVSGEWTTGYNIPKETWTHISVSYDASSTSNDPSIYINGVKQSITENQTPSGAATDGSGSDIYIGRANTTYVPGAVDEVKIYNYDRTSTQVIEDMNAGHPVPGSPVGSAIAYWKFDEGTGNLAYDESINSADLNLNNLASGSYWTNEGKFGKAYNVAGIYKAVSTSGIFSFGTGSFTINMWVKSSSSTAPASIEYLAGRGCVAGSKGYVLYFNTSGQLVFGIDDDTTCNPDDTATTSRNFYDNQWHMVTAVKTLTSRIDIYVDGVLQNSDTTISATTSLDGATNLIIGDLDATDNGDEFNGNIDETAFYDTALTSDQIKLLFNRAKSASWGAVSTDAAGSPSYSDSRSMCVPGSSDTCSAPISHWPLDDNTGTTASNIAQEHSGNENGTLQTGTSWTVGKIGAAVEFDGSSGYISTADLDDLDGVSQFTVSAWVKQNSLTDLATVFSKTQNSTARTIMQAGSGAVGSGNNDVVLYLSNGSAAYGYTTGDILTTDTWNLWTMVYDGSLATSSRLKFYLNGKEQALTLSGTIPATTSSNAVTVLLGAQAASTNLLNGTLDDVRIYNYPRTAAQIAWEYNRGAPVAEFKLDECSGDIANDTSRTSNNESGGNNGTITIGGSGSHSSAGTCSGSASDAWYNGASGKRNGSLAFDGTDDYVSVTDNSVFDITTKGSITAWINPTVLEYASIIGKWVAGGNQVSYSVDINPFGGVAILLDDNGAPFTGTSCTVTTTTTPLVVGNWHHVAFTYDASTPIVYIDGRAQFTSVSGTCPSSIFDSTSPFTIGALNTTQNFFNGLVDEVKVYNYPLTADQIRTDFNAGSVNFGY